MRRIGGCRQKRADACSGKSAEPGEHGTTIHFSMISSKTVFVN
jgi:hypothetical protein